jgi:MFS family permease
VGLWVRLRIAETPDFQKTLDKGERVRLPMLSVLREHPGALLAGTFALVATFVLFYLMTVFNLSWGTAQLGYTREQFLLMLMIAVLFFGAGIPVSALLADRYGRRLAMVLATVSIIVFGLFYGPLFSVGNGAGVLLFLIIGMTVTGLTYGPCGTLLADMFPTAVRYTGASLAFNLAGILGASLTPSIATYLATRHGVSHVGYYLAAAATLTLIALLLAPRTKA